MSGVYINENAYSKVNVAFPVAFNRIKAVLLTYTCQKSGDRVVLSDYDSTSVILRGSINQNIDMSLTVLYIQHSISRVRYTLKSGSSSSVIKLSSDCSFADSNGYINLVVFNKLAYVYWRGLKLHSVGRWTDGFTINKKLANNNAWIDVVLSNSKSNISDCGFEARGDTCVLVFNNTSSGAVKTSAFTILELAQHSISQVTLKTVNGITCTYRVWSKKVVECCVSGTTTNTLSSGSVIDFGTIPSGLRPKTTSFIICNVLWNGGKVYFRTYNDGSVSVLCADQEFSGGSSVRCSRTWIIQHSISPTKLSVTNIKSGFAITAIKMSFGVLISIYGSGSPLVPSGEQWGYEIAKIPALAGTSLEGICGFMWTQYVNHNDAVWAYIDKNTGSLRIDYKSETQDWIYTLHVDGILMFSQLQHSISPTTLWSGKTNSGAIRLSESIYNYSVVGFWVSAGSSDDGKDRLVLCGVTPNMNFISGASGGMSNSDIRDIRVGFTITSATTLTYVNVIRTMLYTNEWTVQGINHNRNVFGVVGIAKA